MNPGSWINGPLTRFGVEIRRTDSARRAKQFKHHGVDLVLDVGAAVGEYGRGLRRAGYRGRIVSFEPLDAAFGLLEDRVRADPQWSAMKVALGAEEGDTIIHVAGNSDSSSLLPMLQRHLDAAPHTSEVGIQAVKVHRLDELAGGLVREATAPFLKIDTQGYEGAVLDGAHGVLGSIVGVQLELSFVPLYEDGLGYQEAITRLVEAGFILQGLEPGFRDQNSQQLLQADAIFFREH